MERVEPCTWKTFQTEDQEETTSSLEEKKDEVSEEILKEEGAEQKEEPVDQDALGIEEIEEIMCSMMNELHDENATANALRKRFPAKASMKCHHVIPFSSDRKYSGAVFQEEGTYLMGSRNSPFSRKRIRKLQIMYRSMQRKVSGYLYLQKALNCQRERNFQKTLSLLPFCCLQT